MLDRVEAGQPEWMGGRGTGAEIDGGRGFTAVVEGRGRGVGLVLWAWLKGAVRWWAWSGGGRG